MISVEVIGDHIRGLQPGNGPRPTCLTCLSTKVL
jgi:hypothetical protein